MQERAPEHGARSAYPEKKKTRTFEYVPLTSFSGDSIIQFDETEKSEGNNDVQG